MSMWKCENRALSEMWEATVVKCWMESTCGEQIGAKSQTNRQTLHGVERPRPWPNVCVEGRWPSRREDQKIGRNRSRAGRGERGPSDGDRAARRERGAFELVNEDSTRGLVLGEAARDRELLAHFPEGGKSEKSRARQIGGSLAVAEKAKVLFGSREGGGQAGAGGRGGGRRGGGEEEEGGGGGAGQGSESGAAPGQEGSAGQGRPGRSRASEGAGAAVLSKDFPSLASLISFFYRLFALEPSFSSPILCSRLLRQSVSACAWSRPVGLCGDCPPSARCHSSIHSAF
ncbi:hypothetical protein MPTK1_1g19030 [Marchantia polymorpha subsp. ruderalis]|uniref:Uncharacterized protein n=2 Tax=Marchantia polymorpha TaxID=3197 RepID=A0AAF6ARR5_MARPO|nr:hypothetical protein MARPO_0001s0241 [Marchantia polymorpha]BBM99135.1 hypothetical protein Mp_1g19030 [Marchantia polymorpha subsp. ruderalis]|eukprot:PTQ50211.1 hypothetical protein MARPO_0001s0241 [Marchantia polymorpha]